MWPPTQNNIRESCALLLQIIHGDGCSPSSCVLDRLRQRYPTVRDLAYKLWDYRRLYGVHGVPVQSTPEDAVADWLLAERVWHGTPITTVTKSKDVAIKVDVMAPGWPGTYWIEQIGNKISWPCPDMAKAPALRAAVDAAGVLPVPVGYEKRRENGEAYTKADNEYDVSLKGNAKARHELYESITKPMALHRAARYVGANYHVNQE